MSLLDKPLSKKTLLPDPIEQFKQWFQEAKSSGETDPTAMCLSSVNRDYAVNARMVLLKNVDHNGFSFFTNYKSPKAKELLEIPHAAIVFWWPLTQRQVRIRGEVALLDAHASDQYFVSRARESQITSCISKQSTEIADRESLLKVFDDFDQKHPGIIQRPDYWGGFVLTPQTIEFWQAGEYRLSDRFEYHKQGDNWVIAQLSP